ncbi:MAG TPA: hypothetical protein VJQ44_16300 [Gemmatimonadales bacterium]|nr:hypothetical protein [Gemmatimonadales bacterium]
MPRHSFSRLRRPAAWLGLGLDIHVDPLLDGLRGDPEFERVNRGL